jgi:3-phenylpropionate/trans-cinnamate dioxygenase ferredoxin reductase component
MSDSYDWLIVGGGPAGIAAARGYRDSGGEGRVAIVTDEHRMPYHRPPLTKQLLRGEMSEDELPLESEEWLGEQRISLISGRAVSLDPDRHEVMISGGRALEYRAAVLATGAEPTRLAVPGADHPGVRVIRTLDHVRELIARLRDGEPVVVIGSGFIGCEIAASLRRRGHRVTLVSDESEPNAARLGEEAARQIRGWLAEEGVDLRLGAAVERIEGGFIVFAGAAKAQAPVLVMAGGVAPRVELAVLAGLELESGAVPVDVHQRTAKPDLYAAGDVAFAENATAGRHLRVEHWGDALGQGEVAGRNAAGADAVWDAVPGFWSTIGDHTLKYAAWGDGFDESRFEDYGDGAFTVWYGLEGTIVGVLTHERDEDYERGSALIAKGAPWR